MWLRCSGAPNIKCPFLILSFFWQGPIQMQIEHRIQKCSFCVDGSQPAFPACVLDVQFPRVLALFRVLLFACVVRLRWPPPVISGLWHNCATTKVKLFDALAFSFAPTHSMYRILYNILVACGSRDLALRSARRAK